MEARFEQGQIFKKIIESITDLIDSANFSCSENGISLQAMDSSHVSLICLSLEKDGFEHYRCSRNISLGVPIGDLHKVLKCADSKDTITMQVKENDNVVHLIFEDPRQTRLRDFTISLMDIDSEQLGVPEAQYKAIVNLSSSFFQKICKEISIVGDTVNISVSKNDVKFKASGTSRSGTITCKQNLRKDEEKEFVKIELKETINQTFALRYLTAFSKAASLADFVSIKMSPDFPLLVEFQIDLDQNHLGTLKFYLAPKLDDDDQSQSAQDNSTQ